MRKDAERNREKLIAAAREIMRTEGGDVPFEAIAERAGITRGTIYRNFADRAALYKAVLDHELGLMVIELEARADDPLAFIRRLADMMIVYDTFLSILPSMADYQADGTSRAKIVAAIAPSLNAAQARGLLRPDLTGADIVLVCRMLASDWRLDMEPTRDAALTRRIELMMRGLSA